MKFKEKILPLFVICFFPAIILSNSVRAASSDGFVFPVGGDAAAEQLPEGINTLGSNPNLNDEYNLQEGIPEDVNNDRRCMENCAGWYNANDVGNFVGGRLRGLHPGEDWNLAGGDIGESVFAISNGTVVTKENLGNLGYCIVIEHKIPDGINIIPYQDGVFTNRISSIYSKYLHVTAGDKSVGDDVTRGDVIATIAENLAVPPHLHFEITTQNNGCGYPNGSRNNGVLTGYYNHNQIPSNDIMGVVNTEIAMGLMAADGILDPSDFINANRNLVAPNNECNFNDIGEEDASYNIINSLCQNDVINGYPNGTVRPTDEINRAEFVKIISIAVAINEEEDLGQCIESDDIFSDVVLGQWYCHYVKYAKRKNIINGYQDTIPCEASSTAFCPEKNINYLEVAKIISTALSDVTHRDNYWIDSTKRNNDGSSKDRSYIGCADRTNAFSFNENDNFKSGAIVYQGADGKRHFKCDPDNSNYCITDNITRERAFAAIYNTLQNTENLKNCFE